MKKVSSAVWKFFDRIEEKGRCVAVLCKLCENQYKFFGNTTNLRAHLKNKHPIQWEFSEITTLDDSQIEHVEVNSIPSSTKRKKAEKVKQKAEDKTIGYSVSIDNDGDAIPGTVPRIAIQRVETDSENDEETLNLVRQMHGEQNSGEEWLEEDPYQITHIETYEPQPKRRKMKYRKVKREVTSPTDLPGYYIAPKDISFEDTRSNVTKDEYSVFGEYIANKLRKLKTPRTRGNIQQLITTILWQAEYGMYDKADAVKRVLMHSIQEPSNTTTELEHSSSQDQVCEVVIEQTEELNQSQDS